MLAARKIGRARARGLQWICHVLLAVQALSLWHLLAIRHVTCPRHGDIMHVEHGAGPSPDGTVVALDNLLGSVLSSTKSNVDGEHHHCLLCAETARRCSIDDPTQALAVPVFVASKVPALFATVFAPIEVLLLSPKNSPPSV